VGIAARLGHAKATIRTKDYARRVVGRDVEIAVGLDAMHAMSWGSGTDWNGVAPRCPLEPRIDEP